MSDELALCLAPATREAGPTSSPTVPDLDLAAGSSASASLALCLLVDVAVWPARLGFIVVLGFRFFVGQSGVVVGCHQSPGCGVWSGGMSRGGSLGRVGGGAGDSGCGFGVLSSSLPIGFLGFVPLFGLEHGVVDRITSSSGLEQRPEMLPGECDSFGGFAHCGSPDCLWLGGVPGRGKRGENVGPAGDWLPTRWRKAGWRCGLGPGECGFGLGTVLEGAPRSAAMERATPSPAREL